MKFFRYGRISKILQIAFSFYSQWWPKYFKGNRYAVLYYLFCWMIHQSKKKTLVQLTNTLAVKHWKVSFKNMGLVQSLFINHFYPTNFHFWHYLTVWKHFKKLAKTVHIIMWHMWNYRLHGLQYLWFTSCSCYSRTWNELFFLFNATVRWSGCLLFIICMKP